MNKVLSTKQFTTKYIESLILTAILMIENPNKFNNVLKNKIMVNLFFEPSTRTSVSFQTAMIKLGGNNIKLNPSFSSIKKKESLQDMITVMEQFVDIIVIRHSKSHILDNITISDNKVLINAGDGDNEHPTQALLDLLTIFYCNNKENKEKFIKNNEVNFSNLSITLVGDLKYSRTIHSLIYLLCLYNNITFNLVSPNELRLPPELKGYIIKSNCSYIENNLYTPFINNTDVLYMTRIQKERFKSINDYEKVKNCYNLTIKE